MKYKAVAREGDTVAIPNGHSWKDRLPPKDPSRWGIRSKVLFHAVFCSVRPSRSTSSSPSSNRRRSASPHPPHRNRSTRPRPLNWEARPLRPKRPSPRDRPESAADSAFWRKEWYGKYFYISWLCLKFHVIITIVIKWLHLNNLFFSLIITNIKRLMMTQN